MKQRLILSLFFLISSVLADCPNSTFSLIYTEDKRAFHARKFHIFYEKSFKNVAEDLKCRVSGTVKKVTMEQIEPSKSLSKVCKSEIYSSKIKDRTLQRNYMVTISRKIKYPDDLDDCTALNQFNMMKTPKKEWAVLIKGHATNIMLPMSSKNGNLTNYSVDFALNSLFFASSYGFGEFTYKSLGGETGIKKQLMFAAFFVYVIVTIVATVALVVLVVLYFMKRNADIKQRESEKSKLLRNPANNECDDNPVEIIYEQ